VFESVVRVGHGVGAHEPIGTGEPNRSISSVIWGRRLRKEERQWHGKVAELGTHRAQGGRRQGSVDKHSASALTTDHDVLEVMDRPPDDGGHVEKLAPYSSHIALGDEGNSVFVVLGSQMAAWL
jgi:hypothetical protein